MWRQAGLVAQLELQLFRRYPRLLAAVLGIVFIPAVYAFIYLESVWDPVGRTAELPALIVNQDEGTVVRASCWASWGCWAASMWRRPRWCG